MESTKSEDNPYRRDLKARIRQRLSAELPSTSEVPAAATASSATTAEEIARGRQMAKDRRQKDGPSWENDLYTRIKNLGAGTAVELWGAPLKPASELDPDNIASELWKRGLLWEYEQYHKYFDRWWKSLYKSLQASLDALVDEFRDYDEWLKSLTQCEPQTLVDNGFVPVCKAEYLRFVQGLSTVSYEEFISAKHDQQRASEMKARFVAGIEHHITRSFGLGKQRPVGNADRDRMLSKWRHWGLRYSTIEELCKKKYPGQVAYGDSIRKAIVGHRKRTRHLRWALRVSIYVTEIPPIRKPIRK